MRVVWTAPEEEFHQRNNECVDEDFGGAMIKALKLGFSPCEVCFPGLVGEPAPEPQ